MITTNRQLIAEVRKPGKVFMSVCGEHDAPYMAVEKSDLLHYLQNGPADEMAPWRALERDAHGLWLATQTAADAI